MKLKLNKDDTNILVRHGGNSPTSVARDISKLVSMDGTYRRLGQPVSPFACSFRQCSWTREVQIGGYQIDPSNRPTMSGGYYDGGDEQKYQDYSYAYNEPKYSPSGGKKVVSLGLNREGRSGYLGAVSPRGAEASPRTSAKAEKYRAFQQQMQADQTAQIAQSRKPYQRKFEDEQDATGMMQIGSENNPTKKLDQRNYKDQLDADKYMKPMLSSRKEQTRNRTPVTDKENLGLNVGQVKRKQI